MRPVPFSTTHGRAAGHRLRARTVPLAAAAVLASGITVGTALPSSADPGDVTVTPAAPAVLVDGGDTARVGIRVDVEGGGALSAPVHVDYATGAAGDTATAGSDYAAASGRLAFPAGTASGTTKYVRVATHADGVAEEGEVVHVSLQTASEGATVARDAMVVINAHGMPYLDAGRPVAERVADLMGRMSLAEKIGQMTQAERGDVYSNDAMIRDLKLGSVLSGGGSTPEENTPHAWADMIDRFQTAALSTRLQIPMIYGIDAVHGNGNLKNATIFPHNVGLGSTRNPRLVERVAHVTAKETRTLGIPWNFAPCICVARDERWGRAYEAYAEVPWLVKAMETSIDGYQGHSPAELDDKDRVLATLKHFAGDGDTEYGTGSGDYVIDQGITVSNRERFAKINLSPFVPGIHEHHAGSVMPSFSSVDWTEDGVGNPFKMHESRELITGWLKKKHDFDGFVITDWLGIHQISGDPGALDDEDVRLGVNAGNDMFMEPGNAPLFIEKLTAHVESGAVRHARINDAVRRILTKKFQLGLFEKPFADRSMIDEIYSAQHRAVARQAAAESQVLLKNKGGVLPLSKSARIYVAGAKAHDLGAQMGGWTIQWQGVARNDDREGTTILEAIRKVAPGADVTYSQDASASMDGSDVGVVVVGETAYAEGFGDVGGPTWPWGQEPQKRPKTMRLKAEDKAAIDKVCGAMQCVVLVVSGRPQIVDDQLGRMDALVASWLPGSEGEGVADVLFGNRPFTGQLSKTWPRSAAQEPINVGDADYDPQFPFGWGLRTDDARSRLAKAAAGSDAVGSTLRAAGAWHSDGSIKDAAAVNAGLAEALRAAPKGSALEAAIVSVARDQAQAAVEAGTAAVGAKALIADADVRLLQGDAGSAYALLLRAAGV